MPPKTEVLESEQQHMPPRRPRRRQRAAASISVQRCYTPDLTRQAQALLRLLEGWGAGTVRKQHGEDVTQRDGSLTRKEMRNDEME
jgi:hypothetical protein